MGMTQKETDQLNTAKAEIKRLWIQACKAENIPIDSKFVVFAESNGSAMLHNQAMGNYFKLVKRIRANVRRRERHAAMTDLGLKRVRGSLGGVYYE